MESQINKAKPIFYSFRRCPYAMRARMALAYAEIDYEHREISLKNKPQSMLGFSPKGTVPVLIIDEKVIEESLDVMKWALVQKDDDNWLLQDDEIFQMDMQKLIILCDKQFKTQLDCYKYSDRHELSEVEYRDQTLWFLEELENRLLKNKFLISDCISLADVAIFPFIRQYAFVNKLWFDETEYHNLKNWLQNNLQSGLFTCVMHKHQLWQDNE